MARRRQSSTSFNQSNFSRLSNTYALPSGQTWPAGPAGTSAYAPGPAPSSGTGWGGYGGAGPAAGARFAPPPTPSTLYAPGPSALPGRTGVGTGRRAFTAAGTYDKVAFLAFLALVSGVYGYKWASSGVAFGAMFVGFGVALVGSFRPQWAKVAGPSYALIEGVVLGYVSSAYASTVNGIVPDAIVFTGAVFLATWAAYRTGLVRVTHKFIVMTMCLTAGLAMVFLLSIFGLPLLGVDDLGPKGVIFGVLALLVAVFNLFVDFSYVETAAAQRLDAEGEWYAAFAIMLSLVLVYLSVLRILAAAAGGGGRR